MNKTTRSIMISSAALLLALVGFFLLSEIALQSPFDARKTQEVKAERALLREKAAYLKQWQEAKLLEAKLNAQKEIAGSSIVVIAGKVGTAARNLWVVWLISFAGAALYIARHRLQEHVEFVFGDLRSMIPASESVRLTEAAIKAKAVESGAKIAVFQEDVTRRRLMDVRSFAGLLKSPQQPALPATADAQPLFAIPSFAEILTNLEPGDELILGYNLNTGEPLTGTFDKLYSAVLAGASGSGKTSWGRGIVYQSQKCYPGIEYYVLDPHERHGEGLSATLPKTTQFTYLDKHNPVGGFIAFETRLDRRLDGKEPHDTPLVFICDELKAASKKPYKDPMIKLFDRITEEGRKCNTYLLALTQDTRQKYGLTFRDSLESAYAFKMHPSRVKNLLQDTELEHIHKAIKKPGIALLVSADGESCVVKVPECSPAHAKYLDMDYSAATNAPVVSGNEGTDSNDSEEYDQQSEPELTPDFVKTWIEDRKTIDPKYSQNKLAEEIGYRKKDLSLWMNNKLAEPKKADMETALDLIIFGPKDQDVIDLKQWQERRRNPSETG